MAKKQWVHDADSGGIRIPEAVRQRMEKRLRRFAEERFAGRYSGLEIHFRGQFCYVDAYTEPEPSSPDWLPADWPESREEYLERLRSTPTHLCRLRYFGDEERWGFGFYSYASERYELSLFPTGEFFGSTDDCPRKSKKRSIGFTICRRGGLLKPYRSYSSG